jgi:hypothetical protein
MSPTPQVKKTLGIKIIQRKIKDRRLGEREREMRILKDVRTVPVNKLCKTKRFTKKEI